MVYMLRFRRPNKQWQEIDAQLYEEIYAASGGSVITHPHTIKVLENITGLKVRYLGYQVSEKWIGALPLWGNYLVGDKRKLKKEKKNKLFDMGNAEVILPLVPGHIFPFEGIKGQLISELNLGNIEKPKQDSQSLSLARSFKAKEFSSKFRYNRRRELARFEQDGGRIVPFSELSEQEVVGHYTSLFELRWGKKPKGHEKMAEFFSMMRPLLWGHMLTMRDLPAAIQIVYLSKSVRCVSAEYVNGGVDPAFKQYSPGSILSYINIQQAEAIAQNADLNLRFSFGLSDNEYKNNWCNSHPVFRI